MPQLRMMAAGISAVYPSTAALFPGAIHPAPLHVHLSATVIGKTRAGVWEPSNKAALSRISDGSAEKRTSTLFK